MNNTDEWFDIYDDNDQRCGRARRSECHGNPDLVHRTAHVIVFGTDGRVLLQKRAAHKDTQPGKWDTAVGGHLAPGEDYEQAARREMAEELGLNADLPLQYLCDRRIRNSRESENVRVFGLTWNGPFQPEPGEIDEVRFWSRKELQDAMGTGQLTPSLEAELDELNILEPAG